MSLILLFVFILFFYVDRKFVSWICITNIVLPCASCIVYVLKLRLMVWYITHKITATFSLYFSLFFFTNSFHTLWLYTSAILHSIVVSPLMIALVQRFTWSNSSLISPLYFPWCDSDSALFFFLFSRIFVFFLLLFFVQFLPDINTCTQPWKERKRECEEHFWWWQ